MRWFEHPESQGDPTDERGWDLQLGMRGARPVARDLEADIVDVAPIPVFAGLERLHDRVALLVEVTGRMAAG